MRDIIDTGNFGIIKDILDRGEQVYMKDDFYEVAIRLNGGKTSFLKHKGKEEVEIDRSYDMFLEIKMGGEFITKEEYDAY